MKCEATQELVVGGFTDPQGGRVGLGALLVGYFEGRRLRLCGQGRHRLRHEAVARSARAAGRARDPEAAVHQGHGPAAPARTLGAARDRRAGRVHRMDGPREAPPPAAARRSPTRPRASVQEVMITHPEKVLFPDDGITKGELAAYYEAIAPVMLPHIAARPVTMERYPAGIGKKGFLQKDVSKGFPEWLERVEVPKKDGTVHHPLITRHAIAALGGQSEHHHAARLGVARARSVPPRHLRLRSRSLATTSRTSLRVAALGAARSARGARPPELGQDFGLEGLSHRRPARRKSADRRGRAVRACRRFDVSSSTRSASTSRRSSARPIAAAASTSTPDATATARRSPRAYTVRAKPGAPVSAPCTWEELERGDVSPQTFTLRTMEKRIADVGDVWSDMRKRGRSLTRPMERLRRMKK